ncbi:PAS domain-containing protein [Herbaspirillum sp. LeCh32-8]|uniref:ATP-binding protein n=1 Tax=Herbaspirillum sp. LeCh32-8 TaxID=2821356 RepID=UPI001AE3EFAB|nr:ATP-binding protein [Herbaspirillum sp. LeCh32-8]MBP0599853.1 PAS domain-containing protein [Herbaspirillum sp. LeCh32-8]
MHSAISPEPASFAQPDAVANAFFSLDADWRFIYLDGPAKALIGRPPLALPTNSLWDAFPELLGSEFEEHLRHVARDRLPRTFIHRHGRNERSYEIHCYADAGNLCVCWRHVAPGSDVAGSTGESDRRRRFYETFLSNTPDLAYCWDLNHRFIYANRVLLQMWNQTWDGAIGKNCLELGYEPWHAEMHSREIEQVRATKQPVRGDVPFNGAFGRRIYDYILFPVLGPDGEVEAVAGTTRDVTERKYTEARQQALSTLAEQIGGSSSLEDVAAIAARVIGEALAAKWVSYKIIDTSNGDPAQRGDWSFGPLAQPEALTELHDEHRMSDALRGGAVIQVGNVISDPQTTPFLPLYKRWDAASFLDFPVMANDCLVAVVHVSNNHPRVWTGHDLQLVAEVAELARAACDRIHNEKALAVSEARLREINESLEAEVSTRTRELMATEEALRHSQKIEAIGQLTGGLAHDFNNLLGGITGSLDLMRVRLAQGRTEDLGRYIDIALRSVNRAASLTQRLLAFARRQTLDPKPTNVNSLITGMEDLVRRSIGPGVELEVVGAGGLWSTLVDAPQLESALLNLCINARDAMPDGGRLTIETANKWLDDKWAHERDLPPGQYVSISVTDTGTGMTPDVISRAFDPFFTTKPIGEGTGLGLSMVYGFARQSGGQIRIYSEVGHGTTISVYLPRHHRDATEREETEVHLAQGSGGSGEVVLVVDDEASIRTLIAEVLGDAGYVALEAVDGPSALRIIQSGVRIDLLVTDVGLPGGINGRQVADAGRALRPDLKVLFITGYAENAAIGNGHLQPGMQLLTKPFKMDTLSRRIRGILTGPDETYRSQ